MQLGEKRIFLDVDLTLAKFSKVVGTNTTYLSNVINQRFGCNFKTLVNRYRIEYAMKHIKEKGIESIGDIKLYGFKSKSTFYDCFTKQAGLAPKAFIKEIKK